MILALMVAAPILAAGSLDELDRRNGFRGVALGTPISASIFEGSIRGSGFPPTPENLFKRQLDDDKFNPEAISPLYLDSATSIYDEDGVERMVTRPGEDRNIGNDMVSIVQWGFYGGSLSCIRICFYGEPKDTLAAFRLLFGEPKHKEGLYTWKGQKAILTFGVSRAREWVAEFRPLGMAERIRADQERERKRVAQTAAGSL